MSGYAEGLRGSVGRTAVAAVLAMLGAIAVPVALVSHWFRTDAQDTDRFARAMESMAEDPDVQEAVAMRMSAEVLAALDLPGPVQSAAERVVTPASRRVVQSDQFATIWTNAARITHQQLIRSLTSEDAAAITIDLTDLAGELRTSLENASFPFADRIPQFDVSYTLVEFHGIQRAQRVVRYVESLGTWMPWVALGLFALAFVVATHRAVVLFVAGLATAGTTVALVLALNATRWTFIQAVPNAIPRDVARQVYEALVDGLRQDIRLVLIASLVAAAVGLTLLITRATTATGQPRTPARA